MQPNRKYHQGRGRARKFLSNAKGARVRAGEALERRAMMAGNVQAFSPIDAWDADGYYDKGVEYPIVIGTPGDIVLPVKGSNDLLVQGRDPTTNKPTFRKFDEFGNDLGFNIAFDGSLKDAAYLADGGLLVWGSLTSSQVGWFTGGFDRTYSGGKTDGFVAKFRANGNVEWGTFVGGTGDDAVNSATIVKDARGVERLVITGETSSRGGFVRGGDTVFDGTATVPGQPGAAATNGFVMVLAPLGDSAASTDNSFQQHVWSSYLSPQDPRTLGSISPAGAFNEASGELVASVAFTGERKANDLKTADTVAILTGSAAPAAGGAPGAAQPVASKLIALKETAVGSGVFRFTAIESAAGLSVPDRSIRRGNKIFYLLDGPAGEQDTLRGDPLNNVNPVVGASGSRTVGCMEYFVAPSGLVGIGQLWQTDTKISVRGMFVDPFLTGDKDVDAKRDRVFLVGTVFDNATQSQFGTPVGRYQQGYGDPLIVEADLDGRFIRHQYVSGDRAFVGGNPTVNYKEKGNLLAVTNRSQKLLVFTTRYKDPLPGQRTSVPGEVDPKIPPNAADIDSGRLYRYDLANTTSRIGVIWADTDAIIVNGDASPSVAEGTDFGRGVVGAAGPLRTFRVSNSGERDLLLARPSLPSGFVIDGDAAFLGAIGPGQSREFGIRLATTAAGQFSGSITFTTNDPDAATFAFAVSGNVRTDTLPDISVADVLVVEGNAGTTTATVVVRLSEASADGLPVTVNWRLEAGTATAGDDFVAASGSLEFLPGETEKTIPVAILGDLLYELDETLRVVLSAPTNAYLLRDTATVTIANDETLSIGFTSAAVAVAEGAAGQRPAVPLAVVLSQAAPFDVTVRYATAAGTATSGSDFVAASGTVRIPAGQTSAAVPGVAVIGDNVFEANETFSVRLSNVTGGAGINPATAAATITIRNDDLVAPLPSVSVSNPTVIEGGSLSFSITLTRAASTAITLGLAYVPISARVGDFVAGPATVTIAAGRTSAVVTVRTVNNTIVDGDRRLRLEVRSGTTLLASGTGTIRDNDRPSTVSPSAQQLALAAAFESLATDSTTKKK
jgi:hypothetical protein